MKKSVFAFLTCCLGLSVSAAQPDLLINELSSNTKLSKNINLSELYNANNGIVKVIVSLKPSQEARELSETSIKENSEKFAADNAPVVNSVQGQMYYDLSDKQTREMLAKAVSQSITNFTQQVAAANAYSIKASDKTATPITITNTFTYSFGFAADVTLEGLEFLLKHKDVALIEENLILKPNLRQGISVMNAEGSRSEYDGSGLAVAIVDTGIDDSHPDLDGGKVLGGYDFGDDDADFRPTADGQPHGTAVAGIVAGDLNEDGDYIGGVAPAAKLYGLKISPGDTGSATSAAMINAWEWAVTHRDDDEDNPILVVNTSFGGGQFAGTCDTADSAMTQAALNSVNAGISHFVSSGNDGFCDSMGWPACISHVNSVGAVYDANIGQPGFCVSTNSCLTTEANPGCPAGMEAFFETSTAADKVTGYSNSAPNLTIFAPSNNAYTTDISGAGGYSSGNYTNSFGGTSAAAPYSSGAAALLQSAAIDKLGRFLTPAEVRSFFTTTGDAVTDTKVAVTKPRINLGAAIAALMSPPSGEAGELCVPIKAANGNVVVLCL